MCYYICVIEIAEYTDDSGRSPFGLWFDRLNSPAAAWVVTALTRVEEQGNFGDNKSVGKGVRELRIHKGPGYRVYYAMDGDTLVILLGGGIKKRQQDINDAQSCWIDYKNRQK